MINELRVLVLLSWMCSSDHHVVSVSAEGPVWVYSSFCDVAPVCESIIQQGLPIQLL